MTDYDRNPEALAWARAKVQAEIDRADRFVADAKKVHNEKAAHTWHVIANNLRRAFIGSGGCVIAAFDERRPALAKPVDTVQPAPGTLSEQLAASQERASKRLQAVHERDMKILAVEAERDGAYRERAQLLALLAALHPSVIAPAPDVDEDGWQILYLRIGGKQASWHIAPRDAELYDHVEHVAADDRRAQWDGHTTEQKYAHIGQHAARLYAEARGRTETPAHERYRFATTWDEYDAGRRAALAEPTQEQS